MLVVEDTPDIRELLDEILSSEGYDVSVAEDGTEAMNMLRTSEFELVLLDLMMPGVTGLEVLALLQTFEHAPPVVAMSAFERFRQEATNLGAKTFLYKPIDVDRLLHEIAQVVALGATSAKTSQTSAVREAEPRLRSPERASPDATRN